MTAAISRRYESLVEQGAIEPDPAQRAAVRRLEELAVLLEERESRVGSFSFARLFGGRKSRDAPRGLYIWGEVGRGKTMLMDLFFDALAVERKRRVHFHAFMAEIHARVHEIRQELRKSHSRKATDPIVPVADAIAREVSILCFDEFSITDIADAMILARLFTRLFDCGVVMVATSNVAPDRLYEGGLQRQNFLPFLDLLAARVDIVHLKARTDFRLEKFENRPVWHKPLGPETDAAIEKDWRRITGGQEESARLFVLGRTIDIPRVFMGSARFTFSELCGAARGAVDYLAIARAFHTCMVTEIPIMKYEQRNEAKRLITLIDTLYDHGVKLIASAEADPHGLYLAEEGKEAFEFRRTASRLMEMRSRDYLAAPHRAGGGKEFVAIET